MFFRCDKEEQCDGDDVYVVPKHGPLAFAGLTGIHSLLSVIRPTNDLAHPLCVNVREGDWLVDYIIARLRRWKETEPLADWYAHMFEAYRALPAALKPAYFDVILSGSHQVLKLAMLRKLGK